MPTTAPADPARPVNITSRPLLRRFLVGTALLVLFTVAALLLSVAIGLEVGTQAALLGLLFAAVPVGIVVPALIWLDRFEAEPTGLLVLVFLWGALIATTVSIVLDAGSLIMLSNVVGDPESIAAVVVAPVVEETLKGVVVLFVVWLRRKEFDGVIDGIVYAGISAAGFAFAENILYLGRAYVELGAQGLVGLFVVRGMISPFAHPLFTMWIGVGIGFATSRARGVGRWLAPIGGFLLAMTLHALWNLSAVAGIEGFWSSYLLLQVPIFLGAIGFVVWERRREAGLIESTLRIYGSYGWLTAPEVRMLASTTARKDARAWARRAGGRPAHQAMVAFQDEATDLAMLRLRMAHGTAGADALYQERMLLDSMTRARAALP